MFIKVNLNTVKAVLSEYAIPKSEISAFAKVVRAQILNEVQANLIKSAKSKLKSTRNIYISGISRKDNQIEIVGFLPNAIESGMSGFDMKEGFAKSPKAKKSKTGGWYLTIPFRLGTPNSSGVNFPAMPREIYRAILAAKKPDLTNYPPNTRGSFSDVNTKKVWEQYENKFSVFSGVTRTNINPETNRSTYHTFRRVSSNSDSNSFIHSGIRAYNLLDQAWKDTDVDKIIDDNLNALL